jgi:hypothetical protein
MADQSDALATWLPVIGKALAYLCLDKAQQNEPEKYKLMLRKVRFVKGLGLSSKDAAGAAGTSAQSVGVLTRRKRAKPKNGNSKKKSRRR